MIHPRDVLKENKQKALSVKDTNLNFTDDFFNVSPLQYYLEEELTPYLSTLDDYELNQDYPNAFQTNGDEVSVFLKVSRTKSLGKIRFANMEDTNLAVDVVHQAHCAQEWENYGGKTVFS